MATLLHRRRLRSRRTTMGDIKLFRTTAHGVSELHADIATLEKHIQSLIETNLDVLLGVRFLASEFSTGTVHGGRIDTLGIDEDGSPVIIEYKRSINENVINQGLFYLDWLMDHKGEFELHVLKRLGKEAAEAIDWLNPRLICIASDFTKYDEHAVQQINRNISLIRYRHFDADLLMFDLVNAAFTGAVPAVGKAKGVVADKTVMDYLAAADAEVQSWYESIKAYMLSLGDDVQMKTTKLYVAFKRFKNFACVEVSPQVRKVSVYVKLPVSDVTFQPGFTRDVTNIGHFGTGNIEIVVDSDADLLPAQAMIQLSYDRN